jgi:hypothetical protein
MVRVYLMPLWLTPPLQGVEARRQTTGFDGLTGQLRQVAKGASFLHGAGGGLENH